MKRLAYSNSIRQTLPNAIDSYAFSEIITWMRERDHIRMAKDVGMPPPWTTDPILGAYRFTNVRREDDYVTRWIAKYIRQAHAHEEHLWFGLCIGRMLNWTPTLREVMTRGAWPRGDHFDPEAFLAVLQDREARGEKVWTGVYTVPAPRMGPKAPWIARSVLGGLWQDRKRFAGYFASGKSTLRGTVRMLDEHEGFGPFMSYQATVDMRFTHLLQHAPDISYFAVAGPGTMRGLNSIFRRPVVCPVNQEQALREMRMLYPLVRAAVPEIAIDFSDVPNLLCELSKYLRGKSGGRLRNRYEPRPAPRLQPPA
jgi:hypothetical protein